MVLNKAKRLVSKIVGTLRHLTERCWHCGRKLHKVAFERQGYLYCSKLCAVKAAKVDDQHCTYTEIANECKELRRR